MHILCKTLIIILLSILPFACTKTIEPNFNEEIAAVLGTRASSPLDQTIWECSTDGDFNQYIYFDGHKINLFYGCFEEGHLQRWSDFYSSDYEMDGNKLFTAIQYPHYGEKCYTEMMSVILFENGVTIKCGDKVFNRVEADPEDLEGMWIIIYVGITPWE